MEAVILIGIQGSGKSTFYRERFFDTHVRISLDVLKTRARERAFLQTCLGTGQRFVVDNTNVRVAERAVYIEAARRAGFQVAGIAGTLKRLERPSLSEGFHSLDLVSRDESGGFVMTPWTGGEGKANG